MSDSTSILKRTALYNSHIKLSAKMVPFAGWEMPVLYQGVIPEHQATRTVAGLFDVSHMGEVRVKGAEALEALNYLTCNNLSRLVDGQAQYGAILNHSGGVVDDIISYRFNQNEFLLCVNASNVDTVYDWLTNNNKHKADFTNESSIWSQIAIQGPKAISITEEFFQISLSNLKMFRFETHSYEGVQILLARTGYTGEDGLELFIPNKYAVTIWEGLLDTGSKVGLLACGLGARDTLRLEAAMPLHGHELGTGISAIDSGLEKYIAFDKHDFIGNEALTQRKNAEKRAKIIGFELKEAGIARAGDKIFLSEDSIQVGYVTSGTKTPTLNKAIGLALVEGSKIEEAYQPAQKIFVEIRGKKISSEIVCLPFYKRAK